MRKCVLYFLIVCLIDILTMVSPQMMNFMIGYVEHNVMAEDNPDIEKEPEWRAYFYPVLILFITLLQTIISSQYFEKMCTIGMNLRTSLISTLYRQERTLLNVSELFFILMHCRKSLKMSGAARKESAAGEIVNLMSVDVQRFVDLLPYLNMIWSSPFQIGLCCYFMYQELGPSIFVGVALLALSIPLNGIINI